MASAFWLDDFAAEMVRRIPYVQPRDAHRAAGEAFPFVWLLDGKEAAELWTDAIRANQAAKWHQPGTA